MRKNVWLLGTLLLVCIACVFVAVLALISPKPGLSTDNFERIEIGMKRAEVEAILGEPPVGDNGWRVWWESEEGFTVTIVLDHDARVKSKHIFSDWSDGRTAWQKLRDYVRRRDRPPEPEQRR